MNDLPKIRAFANLTKAASALAHTATIVLAAVLSFETAIAAKKQIRAAAPVARSIERPPALPRQFIDDRVTHVLRDLKGRGIKPRGVETAIGVPIWSSKQDWLLAVYSKQIVDTSAATGFLSDKLIFYEVAKRELGTKIDRYLAKTVGLRDFLVSQGLVAADGRLMADGDRIESALFKTFPAGFVARPAVGVAPRETGRGLFVETDLFVQELLKPDTFVYRPDHRRHPVRSTVLDDIASGEAIVLQEDVIAEANSRKPLKNKKWREVRVHSYEGRVVPDAVSNFWVRGDRVTKEEHAAAQGFVSQFLAELPATLVSRQAWSFDVLVLDNGEMRIVDLVTNRGRKVGWSTYLDQPRVLGAYTRHFELYAGVHFAGMGGFFLRRNAGNYFGYWGLRIERSRPGVEKILAWIPPWP